MKFSELNANQKAFIEKNIVKQFGAMPADPDTIKITDVFGYEASYRGMVLRIESWEEKKARWGDPDPVRKARIMLSHDPIARQVAQDL